MAVKLAGGQRRNRMKLKIFLILVIAAVYFGSTYCMLNKDICVAYKDYYFLQNRTVSWQEEKAFNLSLPQNPLNFFTKYRFADEQPDIKLLGFSHREPAGRWSEGNLAKLSFKMPSVYSDVTIDFEVSPYVNRHNDNVNVTVLLNGEEVAEWNFVQGENYPDTTVQLDKKDLTGNQKIVFTFKLKGFASPQSLGYGNDIRKLGILFKSIGLVPAN